MTDSNKIEATRRNLLKGMAALGVTYSILPVMSQPAQAADRLHYHTWAGYDEPGLLQPFIDKHGDMPEVSYISSEDESFAKMRSGWSPDVMHPGNYNVKRWYDADLLQPVDTSRAKNWPDIFSSIHKEETAQVDGVQYMIPSEFGNSSVVYRTDLVDEKYQHENSWAILFDEKYKGRIAQYDSTDSIVQCAALVLGMENIYTLDDKQLAEVTKFLVKQRELLRFYWSSPTEMEQAMASGEIVAAYSWNQSLVTLKNQGVAVEMMVPKEGIFTWIAGFTIHKESTKLDDVYDLINAWTSPESGAWLIDNYGYGSTNKKAYDIVPKDRLSELGLADANAVLEGSLFFKALSPEFDRKYNDVVIEVQGG